VVEPVVRTYGAAPFDIAVVHGGPGAGGEMAPVARALAATRGVLEPIQTAASIEGQIEELREVVETHAALPVTLVGFSWGAWLSALIAARHPALVRRLILVGSGPFEERYAAPIEETRRARLPADQAAEYDGILRALRDPTTRESATLVERLGVLCERADAFDPLPDPANDADRTPFRPEIFERVWPEAAALRRSGELLERMRQIQCPIVAIHGDHDPHPAEGVRGPLMRATREFRFVLLESCGHMPWIERRARTAFYRRLEAAILPGMG
jgi:pimeloyl-ACP methyl ester carboxylesterase